MLRLKNIIQRTKKNRNLSNHSSLLCCPLSSPLRPTYNHQQQYYRLFNNSRCNNKSTVSNVEFENYDLSSPKYWHIPLNLYRITQAFRERGHFVAQFDPLEKQKFESSQAPIETTNFHRDSFNSFLFHEKSSIEVHNQSALKELVIASADPTKETVDLSAWGLSKATRKDEPLPRPVSAKLLDINNPLLDTPTTFGEYINFLRRCYCGKVGIEFSHIVDKKEFIWLRHRIEHSNLIIPNKHETNTGGSVKYTSLGTFINILNPSPASSTASESSSSLSNNNNINNNKKKSQNSNNDVMHNITKNNNTTQSFFGLDLNVATRLDLLEQLLRAHYLEKFLAKRYPRAKTFGLEGSESLIPGLSALFSRCSELGIQHVELGMAHRGRLNVLMNIMGKSMGTVCTEFNEQVNHEEGDDADANAEKNAKVKQLQLGDVKYHLGAFSTCSFNGFNGKPCKPIDISLVPNPSHLEHVTPVVVGKVRAKQYYLQDSTRRKTMGVVLHGDASFCGQGIVSETLALSQLPAYHTGGTLHIVINNQIGFTTETYDAHSSVYPTDIAKSIGAPIFHVNGDDPEAVVRVFRLAAEYRHRFRKDVVVDYVCYRRHGHSEAEDPTITQPIRHQMIAKQNSTLNQFSQRLVDAGLITKEEIEEKKEKLLKAYEEEYEKAKTSTEYAQTSQEWLASNWQGVALSTGIQGKRSRPHNMTGVKKSLLEQVGNTICGDSEHFPEFMNYHPDVAKIFKARKKALKSGKGIDMAFAEQLAFGILALPIEGDDGNARFGKREDSFDELKDTNGDNNNNSIARSWSRTNTPGSLRSTFLPPVVDHPTVHVRLSGQDSERGTFNQRHALIVDQKTNKHVWPLNHITKPGEQEEVHICNSNLSEAAVLGFEYGYSLENDNALVLWEAQFGDFANVAQAIIDNFIVSGEEKWNVHSSLVMLLPHGYEGAGPEHSSARPERFLQLVDDDPTHVNDLLTPAMIKDLERGFDAVDVTGTGDINVQDLTRVLGRNIDPDHVGERWDVVMSELEATVPRENKNVVTKEEYIQFAAAWVRRNSESLANFSVHAITTPANYFHALRRQIHRPFSKPLVILTAKQLHHHRPCSSSIAEFTEGTWFRRVISEYSLANNLQNNPRHAFEILPPEEIKRLIIVSGKLYYDLYHKRSRLNLKNVAIIRLEQVAPFPHDRIAIEVNRYKNAEVVFCQEEPENMGFWTYIEPRFKTCVKVHNVMNENVGIRVISRPAAGSPAHGSFRAHHEEHRDLIERAFEGLEED